MLKKLPLISLIALFAISLVIAVMFFLGLGNAEFVSPNTGEAMTDSTFTDPYIFWAYIMFGIVVVLTVVFAIVNFVKGFIDNPKKGITTLVVLVIFAGIFLVSWALGSDAKIDIIGYEGTDNVGFWARFSDMIMYTAYTLIGATFVALIGSWIYNKVK